MLKKRAAQDAEMRRKEQDKLERDRDAQQARIRAEEAELKAERDLGLAADQERVADEYEARMQREKEEKIRKKQVLQEKIRRVEEQKQADQLKADQESAE
jgi:dTMP kinase